MKNEHLFTAERKYDTDQGIDPIHGVLMPSFVFFIKNVVRLEPEIQLPEDAVFDTQIQVKSSVSLEGGPARSTVLRPVKGKQVRPDPKILYRPPFQVGVELQRQHTPCLGLRM